MGDSERETTQPRELPSDPSELLLLASRLMRGQLREALTPFDLSPHQARGLAVICAAGEEGLRLGMLAERLHVVPRSVTELADALVEKGLIERVADPADRRAVLVRPTALGWDVNAGVWRARTEHLRERTARMAPEDRAELTRLLRLLLEN